MPVRLGSELPIPPAPTLVEVLRGTGQGQFAMSVVRVETGFVVARLDGAAVDHFEHPEGWLPQLCGGGVFELRAHRRLNWPTESVEWERFQGPAARAITPGPRTEVDLTALTRRGWTGPPVLVFPQRGDTVEHPRTQGVPKLKEPLTSITIGTDPKLGNGGTPMVDGRHGSMRTNGYFERVFLFGEPDEKDDQRVSHSFGWGTSGDMAAGYTMPGVVIWINRNTATCAHLSREVLRASSGAHLDVSVLEALGKSLAQLRGEAAESTGDALVRLYQVLERLLHTPLVGYRLNPVIGFKRDDEVRIEGVPTGMRLFLVGVCEAELR